MSTQLSVVAESAEKDAKGKWKRKEERELRLATFILSLKEYVFPLLEQDLFLKTFLLPSPMCVASWLGLALLDLGRVSSDDNDRE